ncbi:MAG: CPBP family intramembrane metalloprotease [Bryobacterales bacterium]|nr:CPBP family intramembrane metalloprotease [Bryobacterales bacterium]
MHVPADGTATVPASPREQQIWELLVFLFLIAPSMGLSFLVIRQGNLSFRLAALATILRDLGLVCLVLFFLWRNGEPVRLIGLRFRRPWRDALVGFALFVPMTLAAGALETVLKQVGLTAPSPPTPKFLIAGSPAEFVLAGLLVAVVAVAEEIIFRGYLILRLQAITGSGAAAVILSSLIFSLGHGYEGTVGVLTVAFLGLFFALVYIWRGSLIAPIVLHFLQDFIGLVLVPLLKHQT